MSFLANDIPMIKAIDMPICYTIKLKRALEGLLTGKQTVAESFNLYTGSRIKLGLHTYNVHVHHGITCTVHTLYDYRVSVMPHSHQNLFSS